jgi:hypothetical protein
MWRTSQAQTQRHRHLVFAVAQSPINDRLRQAARQGELNDAADTASHRSVLGRLARRGAIGRDFQSVGLRVRAASEIADHEPAGGPR